MEWVLVLVAVLVLPIIVMTTVTAVATATLRRANQLVPGRDPGVAPLRWLWSPSFAASLHRRLQCACQIAASVAGPLAHSPKGLARVPGTLRRHRAARRAAADGIAQLAREVLEEAVLVDRQIVSANRLVGGPPRAQALAAIEHQVSGVEDAARRVHQLAARRAQLTRVGATGGLGLHQRIAAMEAALSELAPPAPPAPGR